MTKRKKRIVVQGRDSTDGRYISPEELERRPKSEAVAVTKVVEDGGEEASDKEISGEAEA